MLVSYHPYLYLQREIMHYFVANDIKEIIVLSVMEIAY